MLKFVLDLTLHVCHVSPSHTLSSCSLKSIHARRQIIGILLMCFSSVVFGFCQCRYSVLPGVDVFALFNSLFVQISQTMLSLATNASELFLMGSSLDGPFQLPTVNSFCCSAPGHACSILHSSCSGWNVVFCLSFTFSLSLSLIRLRCSAGPG